MRAIVTVLGQDQVGIIASVCTKLAEESVNVLDINQTILDGYFTMVMLVDTSACQTPFGELATKMEAFGKIFDQTQSLSILMQREDIFNAMHRI